MTGSTEPTRIPTRSPVADAVPAATVLIVTHNRKDELRRAVDSALSQNVAVDVLVFDDASKDGTDTMVREVYGHDPRVKYVRSEMGRGPIPARNEGMKSARTPIVFSLDDDAWFTSPDIVQTVLGEFDRPEIAGVQIPCWDLTLNEWLGDKARGDDACWVVDFNLEGSNALRRDAFEQAGGYRGYVRQAEGKDLAIRLLDLGYVCRASRSAQVNHQPSLKARDVRAMFLRSAQNNLMFAWHNVPVPEFLVHVAGNVFNTLAFGLKKGWFFTSIRGILKAIGDMITHPSRRRPCRRSTYKLARLIVSRGQLRFDEVRDRLNPPSAR